MLASATRMNQVKVTKLIETLERILYDQGIPTLLSPVIDCLPQYDRVLDQRTGLVTEPFLGDAFFEKVIQNPLERLPAIRYLGVPSLNVWRGRAPLFSLKGGPQRP